MLFSNHHWVDAISPCCPDAHPDTRNLRGGCAITGFLSNSPKTGLVLVIDQFRADYLTALRIRFLPAQPNGTIGGLRYLMESGAYYPFRKFDLLNA